MQGLKQKKYQKDLQPSFSSSRFQNPGSPRGELFRNQRTSASEHATGSAEIRSRRRRRREESAAGDSGIAGSERDAPVGGAENPRRATGPGRGVCEEEM